VGVSTNLLWNFCDLVKRNPIGLLSLPTLRLAILRKLRHKLQHPTEIAGGQSRISPQSTKSAKVRLNRTTGDFPLVQSPLDELSDGLLAQEFFQGGDVPTRYPQNKSGNPGDPSGEDSRSYGPDFSLTWPPRREFGCFPSDQISNLITKARGKLRNRNSVTRVDGNEETRNSRTEPGIKDASSKPAFDSRDVLIAAPRSDGRMALFVQVGFCKVLGVLPVANSAFNNSYATVAFSNRLAYLLPRGQHLGSAFNPAELFSFLQKNSEVMLYDRIELRLKPRSLR